MQLHSGALLLCGGGVCLCIGVSVCPRGGKSMCACLCVNSFAGGVNAAACVSSPFYCVSDMFIAV